MASLAVLVAWVLDVLSLRRLSDRMFMRFASSRDAAYPVHRAIWGLLAEGDADGAYFLARDSWELKRSPRIGRDYIFILISRKEYQDAYEVASAMSKAQPDNPWLRLLAADVCYYFLGNEDKALELYRQADLVCQAFPQPHYPMAVVLKRLSMIYRKSGNEDALFQTLRRALELSPSNFREEEFVLLAQGLLDRGYSGAKETLEKGLVVERRSALIREAWKRMGFGEPPPVPPPGIRLPDMCGVEKIPVRTRLIVEADDPVEIVRTYAGHIVRPGDIVTLSSCVAAIMEGRMLMEGCIRPTFLARLIARAVAGEHGVGAFGASAPMANPLSVQTILEEVGTLRVVAAAALGALGKFLGKRGWFYSICGPQAGQIDDILGALPPYDYYVMMGARDASAVAREMAASLGVEAAIVDANDLGIAWAVGYSQGVDPKDLERLMSDNPAGNQEQQTPVVVVRPLTAPKATRAEREWETEKEKAGSISN